VSPSVGERIARDRSRALEMELFLRSVERPVGLSHERQATADGGSIDTEASPARRARAFLRASPCFKHAELVQMDLMHHRPSDTGSQKQHGLRGSLLRQGRIKTEATAPAAANDRRLEQSRVAGP